jgi:DNA-binding NtrC family response regulator
MTYILIIEPDAFVAKFVQVNLMARKYSTRVVADKQTALALIRDQFPNLVIMDLQSTDEEGFQFLDKLGEMMAEDFTCAIVFTTWLSPAQLDYCSSYPYVCEILYKPIEARALIDTIGRLWEQPV